MVKGKVYFIVLLSKTYETSLPKVQNYINIYFGCVNISYNYKRFYFRINHCFDQTE